MQTKVLFVCLGNICRSPMAQAIFDHKIKEKHLLPFYQSDSAGTAGYHIGDRADSRTIQCVRKNGITIYHRARQLRADDLEQFDWVIAMDHSNYEDITAIATSSKQQNKIRMMRSFGKGGVAEVPDPYFGTADDFQEVFDMLSVSIEHMIDLLERNRRN